ncbi:MAG: PPOX class F420-dependent oxidoreductase [Actinomycetota bacterium]|nr:PPOX class F420-dependent oxidoreductase [Actinomycetota bacterium]
MEIDEARDFLREHRRAVLATFRSDGGLQMCPVLTTVDDEGRAIVSTRETAMKTKNLRRDPRAFLCVFTNAFFGDWVRVDGTAEIVSLPDAMEPLVDYYRRVAGEHDDWDDYREAMRKEQRALLRITIEEAGPDVAG